MTSIIEITDLPLKGAFIIKPSEFFDSRGAFYKIYTEEVLLKKNLKPYFAEEFITTSKKGVLRGLHYQEEPFAQGKLVHCLRGEMYDVIVDLRKNSDTFEKWTSVVISEKNRFTVYIPPGFAHGFLALGEDTHTLYKTSKRYSPEHERGIRYDDSALKISWPDISPKIISEKDQKWPRLKI